MISQGLKEAAARVESELPLMGSSSKEIATYLQKKGIVGVRYSSESCPLAENFRASAAGFRLNCGANGVVIWEQETPGQPYVRVTMPPRFIDFMSNFDNGKFPELEKVVTECQLPKKT